MPAAVCAFKRRRACTFGYVALVSRDCLLAFQMFAAAVVAPTFKVGVLMHWDRLTLAELSFVTLLQVSWNGMGDYTSPAASGNDAGGSVDSWVPFSITDAHNCGLSASTPPFQRFTDAVNASEGWQTQAELGFIAIGETKPRGRGRPPRGRGRA